MRGRRGEFRFSHARDAGSSTSETAQMLGVRSSDEHVRDVGASKAPIDRSWVPLRAHATGTTIHDLSRKTIIRALRAKRGHRQD
jgi:hypothetical protein